MLLTWQLPPPIPFSVLWSIIIGASWYPLAEVGLPIVLLKEKVSPALTIVLFKVEQVILILVSLPWDLSFIVVENEEISDSLESLLFSLELFAFSTIFKTLFIADSWLTSWDVLAIVVLLFSLFGLEPSLIVIVWKYKVT